MIDFIVMINFKGGLAMQDGCFNKSILLKCEENIKVGFVNNL